MSDWNHAICEVCWNKRNPDRQAHRLVDAELERCCFCGAESASGIYVRHDPKSTELKSCKGEHR